MDNVDNENGSSTITGDFSVQSSSEHTESVYLLDVQVTKGLRIKFQ